MTTKTKASGRMGILVGGGPAPGINGVIGAVTIAAIQHGVEVVGILDGFKWLARGDATRVRTLSIADVDQARFRGGSILHTSRENPTKDEEGKPKGAKMANVMKALQALDIRYLVTIGGDDTAFSASRVAQEAGAAIRVAHVPKTIDNDLPLPGGAPTFGFQTARDVGARLVANLVEDARTTQRWYIVVAMGRSAGHLALGMGAAGGASLTLIPEEFSGAAVSLDLVCEIIEGAMLKAKTAGQNHGVAVVAEGVGDLLKEELQSNPLVEVAYDDHGHVRLAEVPLALILKRTLQARAKGRQRKLTVVDVTVGYELRCADPIPFDVEYTQQLGWGAVRYLLGEGKGLGTGAASGAKADAGGMADGGSMISIQAGKAVPIPFSSILDPRTGKTAVRRVDLDSDSYRCARSYMLRLERNDLEQQDRLDSLAALDGLSPEEFTRRYGRVVGL